MLYLVMKLNNWEGMELKQIGDRILPFPISFVKPKKGEVGYVPVFDNYEDALAYAGDAKLIQMVGIVDVKETVNSNI